MKTLAPVKAGVFMALLATEQLKDLQRFSGHSDASEPPIIKG